jgi:uncharacterized NAD(P)/FAD-binding protein YdhS
LTALAILERGIVCEEIVIFEPSASLGRGVAYSTSEDIHLLNVPASRMSAYATKPNHFLDWCSRTLSGIGPDSFVSRRNYGRYLEDPLRDATASSRANVEWRREPARSVSRSAGRLRVDTGESRYEADAVVLALGIPEARLPLKTSAVAPSASGRIVIDPWTGDWLSSVNADESILLVGSGLTAVDVALSIDQKGHRGLIAMLSRHGFLPAVHELRSENAPSTKDLIGKSPRQILSAVREISRMYPWRSVIDELRHDATGIWRSLNTFQQRAFCATYGLTGKCIDIEWRQRLPSVSVSCPKVGDSFAK